MLRVPWEILPLRSESYQYLEKFSLYAVKATGGTLRNSPSPQWKLTVPWETWGEIHPLHNEIYQYLESHEQRFALYVAKATDTP